MSPKQTGRSTAKKGEGRGMSLRKKISEFKAEEDALRDSKAMLQSILDAAPDALVVINRMGEIILADRQVEAVFGYSQSELVGQSLAVLIPERFRAQHVNHELNFFTTPRHRADSSLELFALRKDGTEFPAEININHHQVGGERVAIASVRDISERKQAEEALAAARQLSQATIDGLKAHLCVLDETGTIVSVNRAWREFADANSPVPENCCVGSNYLTICDQASGANSEEAAPFAAGLRRVLSGASDGFDLEYPCHVPGGEQRWFTAHVSRFMVGGRARVVITHENITQRKLAEQRTQASELKYRNLVENMHEVVMETDAEGLFCYLSPNYEMLSGYSIAEELGTSALTHVHPEDQAMLRQRLEQMARNGKGALSYRVQTRSGKWIWVETSARAAQAEDGSLRLVAVVRDISDRVEAETQILQLKRLYATLSQVNQMIVRVKEQRELFQSICDMVVRFGEFSLAWVGLLDESTGDITPVAANGLDVNNWPLPFINIRQEAYKDSLGTLAIRTGQVMASEDVQVDPRLRALHSSLAERPYRASAAVPFKRGGKVIGILGFVSPQAGFFKAKEELALLAEMGMDISFALDLMENDRIKQQWADAFEHSAQGMVIGDVKTNRIRACNPAFAREQGAPIEELIGMPLIDMYLPEDHERIKQLIARSDREGRVQFEALKLRKDGSLYPMQMDLVSVRDETGNLLYRVASQQDITERRQREDALRAEQMRFASVAATMPEAICTFHLHPDGTLNIPYASKAFEEIYGLTLDDVSQSITPIIERVSPDDAQRLMNAVQESTQSMLPWREEYQYQHPIKGAVWLEGHSTPVREADGSIFWYGVTSDITERKRLEEERAEIHTRLAKITAHIPGFVFEYRLTPDGKFTVPYASAGIQDLYELSSEQVREDAAPIVNTVHPEDAVRVQEKILESAEKMIPWHEENRIILPSGREKWVEGHSTPQKEKDGSIVWYGFTQDITERKQAENALRDSESKYRLLAENITDVIWILDAQTSQFRYVSPSVEQMRGYTVEEVMRQSLNEALTPPSLEYLAQTLPTRLELLQQGIHETFTDEIEQPCKDGSTVWTEITTRFIQNPETGQLEVYGVSRNISERKRAEQKLKESEEQYRTLVEQAADGIFISDTQGNYVDVNSQGCAMLGYSHDEVIRLNIRDLLLPEDMAAAPIRMPELTSGKATLSERQLRRKDGSLFSVEISGKQLPDGRILGIVRDITERKRAEEALKRSETLLAEAQKIGRIGHWEWMAPGSQLTVSDEMLAILDLPRQTVITQQTIAQMLTPEERQRLVELDRTAFANRTDTDYTYQVRLPGGKSIVLHQKARITYAADGHPIRMMGIIQDVTDRKLAEDALRRNERILRLFVEHSPAAIAMFDRDMRYIVHSHRYLLDYGLPQHDLTGRSHYEVFPEIPERWKEIHRRCQAGNIERAEEDPFPRADGHTDYVHWEIHPWYDDNGEVGGVILFSEVITERVKAREALLNSAHQLEESRNMLDLIIKSAPVRIFWKDNESRYLGGNRLFAQDAGYDDPAELIGKQDDELVWKDKAALFRQQEREIIESGISIMNKEETQATPDGRRMWVNVSLVPLKGTDGGIIGTLGIYEDITERKRAEEELFEAREIFQKTFTSSPFAIALSRLSDRKIVDVNASMEKMLGYNRAEMVGKPATEIDYWVDPKVRQQAMETLLHDGSLRDFEFSFKTKSGSIGQALNYTEIFEQHGDTYLLSTFVDITERKQADQALKESEERFSTAFFTSPVSQSIITQKTNEILAVNDACCHLFEYNREELIGASTAKLNLWNDPAERLSAVEELQRTGHLLPREVTTRMKSGKLRTVIAEIEPIAWQGIPCFLSTIFDITDRKQAEEALRNSHAIYRQAIEVAGAVPYYQSYYDEGRRVKYDFISEGIRQITGYDPGEFTAKIWDLLTEEIVMVGDLAGYSLEEAIQVVRAGNHPIWKCEHRIRDRQGVIHWVFEAAVELRDEKGVSYGSIGMYQDITERKQAEETLTQRLAELELLYQSGLALSGELEARQIAGKLIEALEGKLNWHHVAVRKYDPESDLLELLAFKQTSLDPETQRQGVEKRFNEAVPNSSQGMSGWVVQHGQTVRSGNVQADERYIETYPGIGSGLYAPMMLGGHVAGVISVESKDLNAFDESDERLLKTVANQAAVAFENANLFQNLQHELTERKQAEANARVQLKRITALNEIDRAIGASLNMHLSLNVLLNQVTLQLGVDAASILLLNPVEQTLEYTAGTGFRTTHIRASRVQLGQGLAGRAGHERNVLHVPDLAEAGPNNVRASLIKDENFVEYFGVPLVAKGLLKGVLEIFNRTPLAFDPNWLDYLETLGAQAAIAVDNAQLFEGMQRSNQELVTAYDATITGWSLAMDLRDKETEGHTQRVTELTLKLAKRLGIDDQEQVQMRRGALLHDIGKLGIPDHILLKPGKLTDEEWQIMRRHPTYAFEMLAPIHYLRLALDIPYCHHEKWDGSGYPRGLKGEHIPLAARIFAIVDVWDALRSDRPYREGWSAQRTRDYIQTESGKHFDPRVVESFLQMLDQSPG